ncbi:MAG TPA: FlhC family transcriptional regulator [Burkholderiaceae bacterium]|nr:FlhC family transcriptional regulator [Burkholderiaceae bacterium]
MARIAVMLERLTTAGRCAELGASTPTICALTGLPKKYVHEIVFGGRPPRGRPAHRTNLLDRATNYERMQLSAFANTYRRLRDDGFGSAESLIASYRHYRSYAGDLPIGFDHAYTLLCLLDGTGGTKQALIQLRTCARCECRFVVGYARPNWPCPFCQCSDAGNAFNWHRRCHIPARHGDQLSDGSSTLNRELFVLRLLHALEVREVDRRTIRLFVKGLPRSDAIRYAIGNAAPPSPWRCPVNTWHTTLHAAVRIQAAIAVRTIRDLVAQGESAHVALLAAHRHLELSADRHEKLGFDRLLLILQHVGSAWCDEPAFALIRCSDCGHQFLDPASKPRPNACPYCELNRHDEAREKRTSRRRELDKNFVGGHETGLLSAAAVA